MDVKRNRSTAGPLLFLLVALLLSGAACSQSGVSDEEYSELENRVDFAERDLGEVRDRVGVLEADGVIED